MELNVLNISWNLSHVWSDILLCNEALFSTKNRAGLKYRTALLRYFSRLAAGSPRLVMAAIIASHPFWISCNQMPTGTPWCCKELHATHTVPVPSHLRHSNGLPNLPSCCAQTLLVQDSHQRGFRLPFNVVETPGLLRRQPSSYRRSGHLFKPGRQRDVRMKGTLSLALLARSS